VTYAVWCSREGNLDQVLINIISVG
jgi:hypothetical protein